MEEAPILLPTMQSRRGSLQSRGKRRPAQVSMFSLRTRSQEMLHQDGDADIGPIATSVRGKAVMCVNVLEL